MTIPSIGLEVLTKRLFAYLLGGQAISMNLAEKIAAAYLRLNGFLLLPHFTVFDGVCHGHLDLVGLRAPGSKEESGDITFPVDDKFFGAIKANVCTNPRDSLLGVVAEVRTNRSVDEPKVEQQDYSRLTFN